MFIRLPNFKTLVISYVALKSFLHSLELKKAAYNRACLLKSLQFVTLCTSGAFFF